MLERPTSDEYDPYYSIYIDKVPDGDIVELLSQGLDTTLELLATVPPDRETYSYADGKWSIREVVGHVIDVERMFAFRALTFARQENGVLPGMDQTVWAAASNARARPLAELSAELAAMRRGHVAMFGGFTEGIGLRTGTASGRSFTVRSLAYIIAGHEIHHRGLLLERYLGD